MLFLLEIMGVVVRSHSKPHRFPGGWILAAILLAAAAPGARATTSGDTRPVAAPSEADHPRKDDAPHRDTPRSDGPATDLRGARAVSPSPSREPGPQRPGPQGDDRTTDHPRPDHDRPGPGPTDRARDGETRRLYRGPGFDDGPDIEANVRDIQSEALDAAAATAAEIGYLPPPDVGPYPSAGRRRGEGAPPPSEYRLIPDEVVIEVAGDISTEAVGALDRQHGLTTLELLRSDLTGTTLLRSRILGGRPVGAAVRELETDGGVMSAQPNYLFALQQPNAPRPAAPAQPLQYAPDKLRLPQAHRLAKGETVLVGMIDSGVDASHPELAGAMAGTFDAIGGPGAPSNHGTAIAGLIAAHARLVGAAPAARILAVRAFDTTGANGSTFNILRGLDWEATKGARVINMSFAGPFDPAVHRALDRAYRRGILLIAAAGNAGPRSPPLYPGADPHVLAVTATDARDKVFAASNRGSYITLAAPGVDMLVAAPDGAYQIQSGTSFSAAEVSGIAALMIERSPRLTPDAARAILLATAKPLGPATGPDPSPRLVDAYQALLAGAPTSARASTP